FPHPDSPTRPRVRPAWSFNDTPRTAWTPFPRFLAQGLPYVTSRSETSNSASFTSTHPNSDRYFGAKFVGEVTGRIGSARLQLEQWALSGALGASSRELATRGERTADGSSP